MKTIVVASTNPVKARAALQGFEKMFPGEQFVVQTVSVPSGVSDQPMTSAETLQGALNRSKISAERFPKADFWVGIEGGVEDVNQEMAVFAWVVVRSPTLIGKSQTGVFFLPEVVASLVRQGKELGEADDIVFNRRNSKQANGAIGILTDDLIDRTVYYEHAVIMALAPFKNEALYTAQIKP
jgi:inosine/xanthosine triphosphatase